MNLFLNLLFPKRCVSCGQLGSYICKSCFSKIEFIEKPVCPVCQRQAIGGKTHPGCGSRYRLDGLVIACKYRGPVKKAIQKVKYRWVFDIGAILVDLLSSNLWRFDLPGEMVLVPVPLHQKRRKWRGFNQAELLTKSLSDKFSQSFADLLTRTVETKSQVGLDKKSRQKNVEGAFALKSNMNVRGKDILLVDDVYTSGATMQEACRILKKAGAKSVWAMAVALG